MIPRISSEQKMCGGVVMSGRGKPNLGAKQILKGIGAGLSVCLLLLCLEAGALQKGDLRTSAARPLLAAASFAASLAGCMTAAYGSREMRRIFSAVPGLILTLLLLAGRWISRPIRSDLTFTLLLLVCTAAPALLVGLRRPGKKRRR